MEFFKQELIKLAATAGGKLLYAILLLAVGLIFIKQLLRLLNKVQMKKMEPTFRSFVTSSVKVALYVLLAVSVIAVMGVPMASITALLASVGVTVGLALQGALGNLAGGIMIVALKPFTVGNFIEAAGQSGTVTAVSLFYTILRTFDGKKVVIPNGTLMNASVINYSAEETRLVALNFTVAYGTDLAFAKEVMLTVARRQEQLLEGFPPQAVVSSYEDNGIKLSLRVRCKNEDYWALVFNLNEQMYGAFEERGISIPLPQMDVHIKQS